MLARPGRALADALHTSVSTTLAVLAALLLAAQFGKHAEHAEHAEPADPHTVLN